MDFKLYQQLAMRTNDGKCGERLKSEIVDQRITKDIGQVFNACLGLSGEVGEINDLIKKAVYHGHELDEMEMLKELGDVMWYVAMMADALGVSMQFIADININKLMKRYPEGFSEHASINRAE
ncbi:nucleoside triphosphate pyrophosphohydrolase family protein [Lachnoclostridium sp.]|uniref:nucleoside triphosphate pyrophosphohydrolase family protein n=1 Tax=Lachnoclostridium sp. TaxID=2028282 RepID=UPI00289C2814|nr:nucleoside triphosphate pyrophosphohydrolase family protein [Lachnoclostridium sp.]